MVLTLQEAHELIRRYYPWASLQKDHICRDAQPHDLTQCHWPAPAVYAEIDAAMDDRQKLAERLTQGLGIRPSRASALEVV